MPGRNRKDVWDNFRRTKKEGNTGVWAICKCCNIGMQGIPARLEKHLEKCVSDRDIEVPVPKQPKKDDSLSSVVSVTVSGTLPNEKQLQLSKRREMCLTDFHKLAFLLDPRYLNTNVLDAAEQESALQKAFELHPDLVAVIAQFRAKASPFIKSYYEVAQQINPHDWWSLAADIPQSVKDIIIGLLSCSPSTASLERLFSSYGWIHSEIRNRLGNEKAAKLLFIFKVLNNA